MLTGRHSDQRVPGRYHSYLTLGFLQDMLSRRDFLAASAAAAAIRTEAGAPDRRKFADMALNLARRAGASYADIRINRYRNQSIFTRERQVRSIDSDLSYGYGVRVLK